MRDARGARRQRDLDAHFGNERSGRSVPIDQNVQLDSPKERKAETAKTKVEVSKAQDEAISGRRADRSASQNSAGVSRAVRAISAVKGQQNSVIDLGARRPDEASPTDRADGPLAPGIDRNSKSVVLPVGVVLLVKVLNLRNAPDAQENVSIADLSHRDSAKPALANAGQNLPAAERIKNGQATGRVAGVPDTLSSSLTLS